MGHCLMFYHFGSVFSFLFFWVIFLTWDYSLFSSIISARTLTFHAHHHRGRPECVSIEVMKSRKIMPTLAGSRARLIPIWSENPCMSAKLAEGSSSKSLRIFFLFIKYVGA